MRGVFQQRLSGRPNITEKISGFVVISRTMKSCPLPLSNGYVYATYATLGVLGD